MRNGGEVPDLIMFSRALCLCGWEERERGGVMRIVIGREERGVIQEVGRGDKMVGGMRD